MKRPSSGPKSPSRTRLSRPAEVVQTGQRWLTVVIAAGALLIPLVMSLSGEDAFRYPKELALRLEVILIVVILVVAWAFRRLGLPRLDLRARWLTLTALICAWTIVCALVSTNRLVSLPPAVRVLEYALLFVVTVLVLRTRPAWFAGIIVLPAIVNGVIYILQELDIWSPFDTSTAIEKHLSRTALLGNPNDAGSYLVVPVLVAMALALSSRRWGLVWGGAAVFILVATFMTHTMAAISALAVALFLMVSLRLRSWPKTIVVLVVVVVAASISFAAYPPLRARALLMRDALRRRDFETFSASRTLPFLAAAEMILDRPLLGLGPGGFAYNYFEYKLRVQQRHRELLEHTPEMNFGEVHNDHLQVASETGLPGYALFLAALVLLASPAWVSRAETDEKKDSDSRTELARLMALPLAASMFVLALAQFPLELVAPAHAYLWAAAAIVAWRMP